MFTSLLLVNFRDTYKNIDIYINAILKTGTFSRASVLFFDNVWKHDYLGPTFDKKQMLEKNT